jgi:SH3-like domain-containing protein
MRIISRLARLLVLLALATPALAAVGPSGLPLPRFVSLAEGEVNARTGPGREYPILWTYTRRDLPVKIVQEYDVWRKIQDHEGGEAWIHSQLLTSRRNVVILGTIRDLHRTASNDSRVVLRAEPGVIGHLNSCSGDWCLIEIGDNRGWIQRDAIWGVLDDEMRE